MHTTSELYSREHVGTFEQFCTTLQMVLSQQHCIYCTKKCTVQYEYISQIFYRYA
jgi:hypothetical protein